MKEQRLIFQTSALLVLVKYHSAQVEYGIFKVDPESKTVKLSLRGVEVSNCEVFDPYSFSFPETRRD